MRIYSDGRCDEFDALDKHYEVARINVHFVSSGTSHGTFWNEPSSDATSSWFHINNPLTDRHPEARIFVTDITEQNAAATPGYFGVWWTGARWAVYNESQATMPGDRTVNVAFGGYGAEQSAALHVTSSSNTAGWITTLDHPMLNHNPKAHLLVQHVWNPPGHAPNYHDHPTGVYYWNERWRIYNEDGAAMPAGRTFFVMAAGHGDSKSLGVWPNTHPTMTPGGTYIASHVYTSANPNYLITPSSIHKSSIYHPLFGWVHTVQPGGTSGPSSSFEYFVWRPHGALQ